MRLPSMKYLSAWLGTQRKLKFQKQRLFQLVVFTLPSGSGLLANTEVPSVLRGCWAPYQHLRAPSKGTCTNARCRLGVSSWRTYEWLHLKLLVPCFLLLTRITSPWWVFLTTYMCDLVTLPAWLTSPCDPLCENHGPMREPSRPVFCAWLQTWAELTVCVIGCYGPGSRNKHPGGASEFQKKLHFFSCRRSHQCSLGTWKPWKAVLSFLCSNTLCTLTVLWGQQLFHISRVHGEGKYSHTLKRSSIAVMRVAWAFKTKKWMVLTYRARVGCQSLRQSNW